MDLLNFVTFLGEEAGELEQLANDIFAFIMGPVMTVFWIGLVGFLVVKGAMIGAAIVKAADEPQLRQEKINSLKYLLIGVAVAAIIAGSAQLIVNYLRTAII